MSSSCTSAHRAGRALRLSRIAVSVAVLAAFCIFICFGASKLALAMGWSAKVQILPTAIISCLSVVGCWIVTTLIFGRIYCSTACPLGTLQDIAAHIPRMSRAFLRDHPYHYAPARNTLRYISLGVFFLLVALGFQRILKLIDPFSISSMFAGNILRPVVDIIGGREVVVASAYSFILTAVILGILGFVAWRRGRLFCNTICPVGNGLSLFGRVSVFHFDIDTDLCTNCRRCEQVCKSQCINLSDHVVDGSRCVVCFNCTAVCPDNAIRYTTRRKQLSIPMLQRISPTPSLSSSTSASAPITRNASAPSPNTSR